MDILVQINGLTKYFGKQPALLDINLEIPRGQVLGLLGKNGSGKTTLLNCLTGFNLPSSGQATIENISVSDCTIRNKVSYMPSFQWLPTSWSVGKILKQYQELFVDFDSEKCHAILAECQIDLNSKLQQLSTGTNAKVKLALTISRKVPLYLLDEPFANIDFLAREDFCTILLKEFSENSSFIIATHIIEEIQTLLDRVVFLDQQKIVGDIFIEQHKEATQQSITDFYREVISK